MNPKKTANATNTINNGHAGGTLKSSQETIDSQKQEILELKLALHQSSRKVGESKDAACQTDLNSINMNEIIRASVILKRKEEEQATYPRSSTPQSSHRPQVQQLHYPSVSLARNDISNRNLRSDEKASLERLYRVNGKMTTVLNKLRAVSDAG